MIGMTTEAEAKSKDIVVVTTIVTPEDAKGSVNIHHKHYNKMHYFH